MGLWDFEARTDKELSFRAGDLLHVARKGEEWCWAVRLDEAGRALAEGYVPHSYLAEEETVESEPWVSPWPSWVTPRPPPHSGPCGPSGAQGRADLRTELCTAAAGLWGGR